MKLTKTRCAIICCGLAALGLGAMACAQLVINRASRGRVHSSAEAVPRHRVGLVLGCAPHLADGRTNLFFSYRMDAAADLFTAGAVDYLLVSGDNSRIDYDEPSAMRDALVLRGVPEERIALDYAGFSTLDSIVRAHQVFGQERFVVISQDFHVRRAIFLAQAHGLEATGYAARDVGRTAGLKTHLREHAARLRAVLDVTILMRRPRYLGEPVPIGAAAQLPNSEGPRSL